MTHRPDGMRRIQTRATPMDEWERVPVGTEVQFETDLGDVRIGWDRGSGRIKISVLAAGDGIDALDVRPVGSNVVTIGLTGERMHD